MNLILALIIFSQPIALNSENTKVAFEVDSTWHLIHGTAQDPRGVISLEDPEDLSSAKLEVRLSVNKFNTDNSSRDERLREVMSAGEFPEVVFTGGRLGSNCQLDFLRDQPCKTSLSGEIKIKDVIAPIDLALTLTKNSKNIECHAETFLDWDRFGIEDPSIIVARLQKRVHIIIDVSLPLVS